MIEIYNLFSFADDFSGNISTFHLAEGPGGFIEAFTFLRKNIKAWCCAASYSNVKPLVYIIIYQF